MTKGSTETGSLLQEDVSERFCKVGERKKELKYPSFKRRRNDESKSLLG
jgi:hypothetical protein